MNIKNIENILENKLSKSPLFYLFCSSKELFHSNFLYWMSTLNKEAFYKLFSELNCSVKENGIKREFTISTNIQNKKVTARLDFLLENENSDKVIIENKVKDIAKNDQLIRIYDVVESKYRNSKNKYILLTLIKGETNLPNRWLQVTYKELSSKINPSDFTSDSFQKSLINKYKEFINNLSELISGFTPESIYNFAIEFQKDLFNTLNKYKLWETYQKICADRLINEYSLNYKQDYVITGYSINNQKATLDFFLKLNEEIKIGISIENNQYRKFIISKSADHDIDILIENSIFFNQVFYSKKAHNNHLKYGKNYKYQYNKPLLESNISYEKFFESINKDLKFIFENKESILNIIQSKKNNPTLILSKK